jgi:hypothetical protein
VSGLAEGNNVYGNKTAAIYVDYQGVAEGNIVHDNPSPGFLLDNPNVTVENNTIYDNAVGIQLGQYRNSTGHTIINNTIVQDSGEALYIATPNAPSTVFENNIISLTNAVGIVAAANNQVGLVSDYNLFQIGAGAAAATWSGVTFATLDDFKIATQSDRNSIAADPKFVDPADDDYTLQSSSPAIDRGDPTLPYFNEPVTATTGNGDRINIGADGGLSSANASPAQLIQLLGQTGGQRYQMGQTATIAFRSAGLVAARSSARSRAMCGKPMSTTWGAGPSGRPGQPSIRTASMFRNPSCRA